MITMFNCIDYTIYKEMTYNQQNELIYVKCNCLVITKSTTYISNYRQYMTLSQNKHVFVRAFETDRKVSRWRVFLSWFAASVTEFNIFRQLKCNVFSLLLFYLINVCVCVRACVRACG